ncbi:MAG: glycosyltransferase family 4 protein [Gemmatimonadota bacterium]
MRILVLHQYFLRDSDAGGSRFNAFARYWTEAGHEVTVICGQVPYTTGGRYADCVGKLLVRERAGATEVLRVYTPDTYTAGTLGRMWAFFGFMLAATLLVVRRARRADVVIATSPPLVTVVPAWVARRVFRVPTVFEVRDLWPESAITTGVLRAGSLFTRLMYRLEALGYRLADRMVVLTPAFEDDIVRRGLAPAAKIVQIPNGADLELFQPGPPDAALRASLGWTDRCVVLYAGAHGTANHLIQWVEAADRLRDDPGILLAAVGDGPQRAALEAEAARRGLTNCQFLGPVPKARMPALVRAADIGAAVLKRIETFKSVYPNKVFDYMASERPVLCVIDGVARALVVEQAGAGVFAEPEQPEAIAAAIRGLAASPERRRALGAAGLAFVRRHFSREALAARYLDLLETIAR